MEVASATPRSTQDPRQALAHFSRHRSAFVLLCLLPMITAPRHAKNIMLETSFRLAPGSCPRATIRRQDGPPLCAPMAVAYVDCWKRIPLVLVTFIRFYGDVCLARTNRFCAKRPFSSEGDEEKRTWRCLVCDGHHAHIGTWRGGSTHAQHMET